MLIIWISTCRPCNLQQSFFFTYEFPSLSINGSAFNWGGLARLACRLWRTFLAPLVFWVFFILPIEILCMLQTIAAFYFLFDGIIGFKAIQKLILFLKSGKDTLFLIQICYLCLHATFALFEGLPLKLSVNYIKIVSIVDEWNLEYDFISLF